MPSPETMVIDGPLVLRLLEALGGQGAEDVEWSENVTAPGTPEAFAMEAIWIICNSGMKHSVARIIQGRVLDAIARGRPVSSGFGHPGKAAAMQEIWDRRADLFGEWAALPEGERFGWLTTLPWIGSITRWHLAKNYGMDVAKPDVHLVRLAAMAGEDVHAMCRRLAGETGFRAATVDLILWRSCATGLIDSRTGAFSLPS